MRTRILSGLLLLGLAPAMAGDEKPRETAWPDYPVDEAVLEVLRKIDAAGAYGTPDLEPRKDADYAGTPEDVEPYGGVRPYKEHFLEQMEYTGPGRAIPEPENLQTVKLGFIGPILPTVSVATGGKSLGEAMGVQMLQGSRLAIEEANARGGYRGSGTPFELVISNDNGLWGASGNEIVKMAYKDRVWAILGTIDGANSHIAIRVALKAELAIINTGDTDPTFIETNIPWTLRVIGDDRQQGYLLVDYIYRKLGHERVGIIRASNRYGRFGVREIRDSSRRLGKPIVLEMAYEVGRGDYALELERLKEARIDAVVHWGEGRDAALILNQMREMGMQQPFFASGRAVSKQFVEIAGQNAEGVTCGYSWDPHRDDRKLAVFRKNFRERFDAEPGTFAAHAYDGMNMVIWATQAAGLNRAKIRDVLAYLPRPWPGVTGEIALSAALDDVGEVFLARFEKGDWHYYSREELKIPDEVRIGYFGPSDPDDPEGGDAWLAAGMAVEQANTAGGHDGLPYRLVPSWSADPWGSGAADLARSVYDEGLWAILGSIDGASTHLAETIVAKARLPLVSPGSTDGTVNLARVPWAFSCLPGDDALGKALASAFVNRPGSPLVISATDHDSRMAAVALLAALEDVGVAPSIHIEFDPETVDARTLIDRTVDTGSETVVVVAGARASARLLVELRSRDHEGPVFGWTAMGRRAFLEVAGPAADGVVFPLPCDPDHASGEFGREFSRRYGRTPDCTTVQTYDAARLTIEAIRRAGLNRALTRDALASISPWPGVAGTIEWGPLGRNLRVPTTAAIHDGRIVPLSLPDRIAVP